MSRIESDTNWPETYRCLSERRYAQSSYIIMPIRWHDIYPIRRWRNAQLNVLRQTEPLEITDQEAYFKNVVQPEMHKEKPEQILFSFLDNRDLVGYGGLVNISWPNRRAEISFLSDPQRAKTSSYRKDFSTFLTLMSKVGNDLLLHRLYLETYEFRHQHISIIDASGFELEGRLRDHVVVDGAFIDSLIHGRLLDSQFDEQRKEHDA